MCKLVGKAGLFDVCLRSLEWTRFREICIKESCANPNVPIPVCTMIAALAYRCTVLGVFVDWMEDDEIKHFCKG